MTQRTDGATDVEVLWRPGCGYCARLRRDLARRGVHANWRNIWEDNDARALSARNNNGNEVVPTVRVGNTWLTNPSGAHVATLALSGDATGIPAPTRSHSRLTALSSWLPVLGLVAISEVGRSTGLPLLSLGADALAVAAWWATRPLRR
ncbi:MAG: hypothetical protein GC157_00490 [Frankiales bacterium]|nr:hypothetical protein [Frankiales bacterium]